MKIVINKNSEYICKKDWLRYENDKQNTPREDYGTDRTQ